MFSLRSSVAVLRSSLQLLPSSGQNLAVRTTRIFCDTKLFRTASIAAKKSAAFKPEKVARSLSDAPLPVWDYEEHGPESWPKTFPLGSGQYQSPINIDTNAPFVKYDIELGPLDINYSRCRAKTIRNVGHSFQVNFSVDAPAVLSGGPLSEKYQLVHFNGHWGSSNNVHGSEHIINSRSYPAELQFVHFNKKYKTVSEAMNHKDGLAIIAVFLKVDPKGRQHIEVQQLLEDFKGIDYKDKAMPLYFPIRPQMLMPENMEHYFTYEGSLTTPPLNECVTWIIMSDPLLLSADQLAQFHELHSPKDRRVIDHNYRPVQPINKRVVRASFPNYNDHTADGPIRE